VTVRTKPRFWHLRTGFTAFPLLLPATTELVIVNLIPQHDPQPDFQLASHSYPRLPQTFLHLFAAIEALQLGISTDGGSTRLAPEKSLQRAALFG
jgi:hypothetical protein